VQNWRILNLTQEGKIIKPISLRKTSVKSKAPELKKIYFRIPFAMLNRIIKEAQIKFYRQEEEITLL
jgi:hypothetical protein